MITKITGRHVEITEAMRAYAEKRIGKLSKYHGRISEMEVVVELEGLAHKVEIIVKADNHQRFVVNHAGEDAYSCIDNAIDKIERQLVRHKEKSRNHKGRVSAAEASADIIESTPVEEEEE